MNEDQYTIVEKLADFRDSLGVSFERFTSLKEPGTEAMFRRGLQTSYELFDEN